MPDIPEILLNVSSDSDFDGVLVLGFGELIQNLSKSLVGIAVCWDDVEPQRIVHLMSRHFVRAGVRYRQAGRKGERGRDDVQSAARCRQCLVEVSCCPQSYIIIHSATN